jgi:hypothetical protein
MYEIKYECVCFYQLTHYPIIISWPRNNLASGTQDCLVYNSLFMSYFSGVPFITLACFDLENVSFVKQKLLPSTRWKTNLEEKS